MKSEGKTFLFILSYFEKKNIKTEARLSANVFFLNP